MRGAKQKEMFEISDLKREILHLRSVCFPPGWGWGGGTLIFSYIRRLGLFGFKILNFNIFFFRKLNIFGGMKILQIFLGVSTKLDYTMHFRLFSESQGTIKGYFWGC